MQHNKSILAQGFASLSQEDRKNFILALLASKTIKETVQAQSALDLLKLHELVKKELQVKGADAKKIHAAMTIIEQNLKAKKQDIASASKTPPNLQEAPVKRERSKVIYGVLLNQNYNDLNLDQRAEFRKLYQQLPSLTKENVRKLQSDESLKRLDKALQHTQFAEQVSVEIFSPEQVGKSKLLNNYSELSSEDKDLFRIEYKQSEAPIRLAVLKSQSAKSLAELQNDMKNIDDKLAKEINKFSSMMKTETLLANNKYCKPTHIAEFVATLADNHPLLENLPHSEHFELVFSESKSGGGSLTLKNRMIDKFKYKLEKADIEKLQQIIIRDNKKDLEEQLKAPVEPTTNTKFKPEQSQTSPNFTRKK